MQRLKTRAQFQAVMAAGIVARTAHFALHRLKLDEPSAAHSGTTTATAPQGRVPDGAEESGQGPHALFPVRDAWIGVILPKRWARRAVTRNAIKRQIYAVSASLKPPLPPAAHVVRLRVGFDRAAFSSATSPALKRAVRAELLQLFERSRS